MDMEVSSQESVNDGMSLLVQGLGLITNAKKVTDRKDGAEMVKSAIEDDWVVKVLNRNSLVSPNPKSSRSGPLTWGDVLKGMQAYVEQELGKKKRNTYPLTAYEDVVKKANLSRPYLPVNTILGFAISRLEGERNPDNPLALLSSIGSTSCQILKSVLSVKLYLSLITKSHWERIIEVLFDIYLKPNSPKTAIMDYLNLAIVHGSNYPEMIPVIRNKILKFFLANYMDPFTVKGAVLLCQHNAIEFRRNLCILGETMIPHILSQYESKNYNMESTVELFLIQMKLHNPCDVDSSSYAYLAGDAAKWSEAIVRIYSFATDAIEEIAKRSGYSTSVTISHNLLTLAVKSTRQVHDRALRSDGSVSGDGFPPSKRQMVFKSFQSILNDTTHLQPSETLIVWLQYIRAVLDACPDMVETSSNVEKLFKMGLTLLNSTFVVREEVYSFLRSLLNCEKHLLMRRVLTERSSSWDHVWDIAIKSLTVNEAKPEALEFLRVLLIEIKPPNLNALLLLYVNSSITPTHASLLLLSEYLVRCTLPQYVTSSPITRAHPLLEHSSKSCPRHALIKWLVTSVMDKCTPYSETHLAVLLSSLIVNHSHLLIQTEFSNEADFVIRQRFEVKYDDFEESLLKACFVRSPSKQKLLPLKKVDAKRKEPFTLVPVAGIQLLECLQHDFHQLPPIDIKSPDFIRKLCQLQYRINILISIYNLIEKHKLVVRENQDFKSHLTELFEKAFHRYINIVSEYLSQTEVTRVESHSLVQVMRALLSSEHLCDKVKQEVSKQYPQKIRDFWRNTFQNGLPRTKNRPLSNSQGSQVSPGKDLFKSFQAQTRLSDLSGDGAMSQQRFAELGSMEALRCLIDFALLSEHKQELLAELIQNCLDIGEKHLNVIIQFHFDVCEELVVRMIPEFSTIRPLHKNITLILQSLCRHYSPNMDCAARLWDIFTKIGPMIARESDTVDSHHYCMILVGGLINKLHSSAGIRVIKAAFNTLSAYARNDPWFQWTVVNQRDGSVRSVFLNLHEYLKSQSQQVRILAVNFFCDIFESDCLYPHPNLQQRFPDGSIVAASARRKEIYEEVYTTLLEVYSVPVNKPALDEVEVEEETVNRTATVLSCLTRIIPIYPINQKRALFCLFLMVKVKNISVSLTSRALQYANDDSTRTMICHILYVLEKWFKLKYEIDSIPFQFFACGAKEEFFVKFKREIGFQCFLFCEGDNTQFLQAFANILGVSVIDLVKECYGMIMGRLCVGLGTTVRRGDTSLSLIKQHSIFLQSQTRLIKIFGGKSLADTHTQTVASLGDIVLNVISLAFDPTITETWDCPEVRLPEPEPPHYDEATIEAGLEYLKECLPFKVHTVLGYLIQVSPKRVYNILLTLVQRIHEAHDYLEKFWRLHHFSLAIRLLLSESRERFAEMKEYVCQFTVYSYLRLLSQTQESGLAASFTRAVICALSEFVEALTRLSQEEMSNHYRPIVSQLIGVAVKTPELTPAVTKVLDFLLKVSGLTFSKCVMSLDPFPSEIDAFAEYKEIHADYKYGPHRSEWTLDKELQNCLDQMNSPHSHGTCTMERLCFLKQLLSQRKFDLEVLVKVMAGKKFSDECSEDIIHNLIQMLIGVIISSQDEEIILEACRCLGEVGPIDLSVLVLPQYGRKQIISSAATAMQSIIESIAEYLISDDINLVSTTGAVLESLLRITECSTAVTDLREKNPRVATILSPFVCTEPTVNAVVTCCSPTILETQLSGIDAKEYISYAVWVTELTCNLIASMRPEGSFLHRLLPLCRLKLNFAEEVLPFVVYACLTSSRNNPIIRKLLSGYVTKFFSNFNTHRQSSSQPSHYDTPQYSEEAEQCSIYMNKLALRCLLRVIHFLRLHTIPDELAGAKKTPWEDNFWLDVNYLDLAKGAQFCGAYLTSILYSEIYAYASKDDGRPNTAAASQSSSYGASLYPRFRNQAADIEKLLLKAYTSIGEPDAVYGCGSARYADFHSNIQHLQQMNQWNRSLSAFDADTSNRHNSQYGVCVSLKELGLLDSLWTYLQGYESMQGRLESDLSEIQYECGWRLSKWDLNCDKASYVKDSSISEDLTTCPIVQRSIYESIQSWLTKDRFNHAESIRAGFKSIVRDFKHASLESSENIYAFLTQFQMFRIIEDFFSIQESGEPVEQLLSNWKVQDKLGWSDLKFQEQILTLRSILLKSFDEDKNTPSIVSSYDDCMFQLLTKARECGRFELAESCTAKIIGRSKVPRKELEVAKNHWARGQEDIALLILGRVIQKTTSDIGTDLYAPSLLLYGEWMSVTKGERPNVILDQYFFQSVKLYESKKAFGTSVDISQAHITLAKYADSLYQNSSSYVKSDMFQEKVRTLEMAKQEYDQLKTSNDSDAKKSVAILQKQIQLDSQEIATTYSESKRFLIYALTHYLRGIKYSAQSDLLVFRAIGLWLDNTHIAETTRIVGEEKLPSYKYVIVLHQLCARLGTKTMSVGEALNAILLKCAEDHPYHTLPVLLAQALMHKDKDFNRVGTSKKPVENDRVMSARRLVESLKKIPAVSSLTVKMEQVWNALISLANVQETKNTDKTRREISSTALIRKLKGIDIVPIPTTSIAVNQHSKYKDFVIGIHSFSSEYVMVGGINSPKRISCIGTDGLTHNMLLKGQDDLRQDAIMQQVFAVLNKLLLAEPQTKARRLQIRTYKVVPLSQRSGIIEWCENTQTFGDYLIGSTSTAAQNPGAHRRYRVQDYTPQQCRKMLLDVKDSGNNSKKLEAFMEICNNFKPVFRHFFFENFKDAGTFFERKLAYTRSVATSSMVGYVLGLGDRHVLNILVDKNTAELIHIDLGVAFEQGRILPTPETIPFRLSRDVVDGMGVCGVEGDFRRSCEMTLEVLRKNSEIILTILEVLLYDPLYIWTLSADRVQKVQPGDSVARGRKISIGLADTQAEDPPKERNNSAARVLLRLKQKLIGVEEGVSSGSTLSVSGHVSLLIQRAMDVERLSRLFPGWQPYL